MILFIGNYSADWSDTTRITLKVSFLSDNCTSIEQPFDVEIMKCFFLIFEQKANENVFMRHGTIKKRISKIDPQVYVFSTWHGVTASSIQNCHLNCVSVQKINQERLTEGKENNDDDGKGNANKEWLCIHEDVSGVKFNDYTSIDQDIELAVS